MKLCCKVFGFMLVIAALAGTPCLAGFQVTIIENGNTGNEIVLSSPTNVPFGQQITFSGTSPGGDITISGLTAQSDSNASPTPLSAVINIRATLTDINTASASSLEILVSDTGFNFPVSTGYQLNSSGADTNLFTTGSDKHTFQSFADTTDTLNGMNTPSMLLTLNLAGGSSSANATPVNFTTGLPYALTNETIVNFAAGGTLDRNSLISGSTTVTAFVPEPASAVMMGTGLLGVIGLAVRRRRRRTG